MKAFLDYNIRDIKLINSLDNLAPLTARDNVSKNDKYNRGKFQAWLHRRGRSMHIDNSHFVDISGLRIFTIDGLAKISDINMASEEENFDLVPGRWASSPGSNTATET